MRDGNTGDIRLPRRSAAVLVIWLASSACEPENLTAAREQINRGGERFAEFVFPVSQEKLTIDSLLGEGRDTVIQGLVAATIDPQSLLLPPLDTFLVSAEVPPGAVDFGDIESAVRGITFNTAWTRLTMTNQSDRAFTADDLMVGVVRLTAQGEVPRENGTVVYETDGEGNPLVVVIEDPEGSGSVTFEPAQTRIFDRNAAPLVDRIVHLVLDGDRAGIVASGSGSLEGVLPPNLLVDFLSVQVDMTVSFDVTLPDTGVVFSLNGTFSGLGLSGRDSSEVLARAVGSGVTAVLMNAMPFGMELEIAIFPADTGDTDVFTLPDHVLLSVVGIEAPAVDGNGLSLASRSDSATVALDGPQLEVLLAETVTTTARIRLLPAVGAGGRGAVRAADELQADVQARLRIRSGGGGSP